MAVVLIAAILAFSGTRPKSGVDWDGCWRAAKEDKSVLVYVHGVTAEDKTASAFFFLVDGEREWKLGIVGAFYPPERDKFGYVFSVDRFLKEMDKPPSSRTTVIVRSKTAVKFESFQVTVEND
jgi:hypothetical protein